MITDQSATPNGCLLSVSDSQQKRQLKKGQRKKWQRKIGLPENWATVKFGNKE